VSPEYFGVLDIGVSRGRTFTQAEASSNAAVAVVSEADARRIWPNGDAVGQVLHLEADPRPETRRGGRTHVIVTELSRRWRRPRSEQYWD
jgi:hypothetical protein